ncbi:MAG: TonB-dependent receptor, partial [Bacteroidales bacterium]
GKVYIQKSQQGGGSPMIRGFATNRLLYTIDGVRMNTAIFRGGNLQNVISLDPFATESTEVLFGPGSVIYGSDAIGGVMSFQTLTPRFSTDEEVNINGKALARYSSANQERTAHFDVNVGWKKWAFLTSVSSYHFDHLKQGSHGPDDYIKSYTVSRIDSTDRVIEQDDPLLQIPSAYSQMNIMQKIRFRPNDHWDLSYGFHYSETTPYGRYDRHNRTDGNTPKYGTWGYGPQGWMMNHLNIKHAQASSLYDEITLRLAQQSFKESRIDRDFNDVWERNRSEQVEAYSVNLDFHKETSSKNSLFYGVEHLLNDVTSKGISEDINTGLSINTAPRYPMATWQSMAIYVNDDYQISEKFSLQGGLRYNHFLLNADFDTTFYPLPFTSATINNGAVTGSIGGVYHPSEQWIFSLNLGTAFRSPNVDDVGKVFDSEPGAVVVPNPDLKAEYAYNLDIGIAKVFDKTARVELTGYYTMLENALVRRNYQINGQDSILYDGDLSQVMALQNAAVANVYGFQASAELNLPAGFKLSSDLNFQVGEEEMEDGSKSPSRHAAPLFGNTTLAFQKGKLEMQLYAQYQGERKHKDLAVSERGKVDIYALDENGNTYAPQWYTLNLKTRYLINDTFSFSAGIENITDQRYRPYSSGISAPGRNFYLSVMTNF